jgi:hypothetical protein
MLEQKEKIIGTTVYLVTQMDGFRALKAQTKLIKILGSALASLVLGNSLTMEAMKKAFFAALPDILSRFDDELVNDFILSLFEVGVFKKDKNGHPTVIDFMTEFGGKINEMWKVALFILEVNFWPGKSINFDSLITEPEVQTDIKS